MVHAAFHNNACHIGAEKGDFSERNVKIPQ